MKLRFSDPSFSIHKGGVITVCVFQCSFIADNKVVKQFKAIGKAILADGDQYNATLARHIAESRAKREAYDKMCKIFPADAIKQEINNMRASLRKVDFFSHMHILRKAETKHIEELVK